MQVLRAIVVAVIISILLIPVAWAANSTPVVPPTPMPVSTEIPPTIAPAPSPAVTPELPAASNLTPVTVARERTTPISTVNGPVVTEPTAGAESQATPAGTGARTNPTAAVVPAPGAGRHATETVPALSGPNASGPAGSDSNSASASAVAAQAVAAISQSAQAPAQLACHGKPTADSRPFLIAPYSGWTEIVSFVDHDSPDYTVDGTIVLANGLKATVSSGQGADSFPSYWSPTLRQYVNYDGHNGYDLGLTYQPVLAAAAGTVEYAGWNSSDPSAGYGQMILINHHNGYATLYGHLSVLGVHTGDTVQAGQQIGISGTTGNSTGPHLHFSVFHNCHVTDPYGWTGAGTDPLATFNGDRATYLWLPEHDPLLLNPPPNWPAYPSGVAPAVTRVVVNGHAARRLVPPADRLLLLSLPSPGSLAAATPAVALARTEDQITQESEMLAPELKDLQRQGLIESFVDIPASGAVWVRGTASASQLEGLDGVASLTGAQTHDLDAAQAGVAHAVLAQVAQSQAPALWPVGFRTGLHAWRPTATIVSGRNLVAGFALPNQLVSLSLLSSGGTVLGTDRTRADPANGGFVCDVHGASGSPVVIEAGETIELRSSGRVARILVTPLAIHAYSHHLVGQATPGTSVTTTDLGSSTAPAFTLSASSNGRFQQHFAGQRPAGSIAVAEAVNASGDVDAALATVPGLSVIEGGAAIRGWAPSRAATLQLSRGGREVFRHTVHPHLDGSFVVDLARFRAVQSSRAGDVLVLSWPRHIRRLVLPRLALAITPTNSTLRVSGPARARVHVSFLGPEGYSWHGSGVLDKHGTWLKTLPSASIGPGDTAAVRYISSSDDVVEATDALQGMVVHAGNGMVTGRARRDTTLNLTVANLQGHMLGDAVAGTNAAGSFRAVLRSTHDHFRFDTAATLTVRSNGASTTYRLPRLTLTVQSAGRMVVNAPAASIVTVVLRYAHAGTRVERLAVNRAGYAQSRLPRALQNGLTRITVSRSPGEGVTIVRTRVIRASHAFDACRRSADCRTRRAGH